MSQDFASKVIAAAASAYGVTQTDLISGGYKNCAAARNAAMAIIMDLSPAMQYARLGLIMDGRQRDTVAVGVRAHAAHRHHQPVASDHRHQAVATVQAHAQQLVDLALRQIIHQAQPLCALL